MIQQTLPVFTHDTAPRIRAGNARQGFPNWSEDGIPLALALIHTEVSEAAKELPAYGHGLGAAFAEELADVWIRAVDLGQCITPGRLESHLPTTPAFMHSVSMVQSLLYLHTLTDDLIECYRKPDLMPDTAAPPDDFWLTLARLVHVTDTLGQLVTHFQFHGVILAKVEKNASRPFRHGNRRL